MLTKIFLILLFLAFFAGSTQAAILSAHQNIQDAVTTDEVTVDNYELAKDDLNAFYAARDFKPAWSFTGENERATFAIFLDFIEQVIAYHGLRPEEYAIDQMRKLADTTESDTPLKLELLTTDTLMRLAHDLHGDNNALEDLYPGWNFHRAEIDIPALLNAAVAANALNEFIEGMAPKSPAYAALAKALRTYRGIAAKDGWAVIGAGPILQPNDRDRRVAQLRARLEAENYLPHQTLKKKQIAYFDDDLRKALVDYQTRNGLNADGHVGGKTLETLNVPMQTRIDQIRANMERGRHMPDDFPPARYALVNIADATVEIIEDSKPVYRGPVIVGKVDRKTPFIRSSIRSMIINPAWHVPVKIAKKDILPKLRKDPHYLEKLGFVIRGNQDDPYGEHIDWESMPAQEFNFRLRQSPGDMNSLGRLKFDFDNDFAVYMHGTPHQELFDKPQRNFSSGCIRLRDPEQVGAILLAGNKVDWTVQKIDDEIATDKTRWIGIKKQMPIFVLYWTVFTDESGALNFRKDVYDYDTELMVTPVVGPPKP